MVAANCTRSACFSSECPSANLEITAAPNFSDHNSPATRNPRIRVGRTRRVAGRGECTVAAGARLNHAGNLEQPSESQGTVVRQLLFELGVDLF